MYVCMHVYTAIATYAVLISLSHPVFQKMIHGKNWIQHKFHCYCSCSCCRCRCRCRYINIVNCVCNNDVIITLHRQACLILL